MRIDSHIHFWNEEDTADIPIAQGIFALQRAFLPKHLRTVADPVGVTRFVLIEAAPNTEETEFILELSKDEPLVAAVVGWVDLERPVDHVAAEIERFRAYPKFRGIRAFPPNGFDGGWLTGAQAEANYRWLADNGLTVDFLITCTQVMLTHALFRKIDGFRPVINHGARPFVVTGELQPWAGEIKAVAGDTQALCKLSGLSERAGVEWTVDTLHPYIATLVEAFGPDRLMFGSNWPVMTIKSTYARWVDTLEEILERLGLSEADKTKIYRTTAESHYGIGDAGA